MQSLPATGAAAEMQPAFAAPVLDAQAVFRVLLQAFSRPGQVLELPDVLPHLPASEQGIAAALLTLADYDTPVWLGEAERAGLAGRYFTFHNGAPIVGEPAEAAFAVLSGAAGEPPLAAFNPGEDRYPDRSATLLLRCDAWQGGAPVRLAGPGLREPVTIAPAGAALTPAFWAAMAANNARYPLGVDVLLVSGRHIMGLPRTTTIAEGAR